MPIFIRNDELDRRLDQLAAKQPSMVSKVKRTPLAEKMLLAAVEACERSNDPEAWCKWMKGDVHQTPVSHIRPTRSAENPRKPRSKRGAA